MGRWIDALRTYVDMWRRGLHSLNYTGGLVGEAVREAAKRPYTHLTRFHPTTPPSYRSTIYSKHRLCQRFIRTNLAHNTQLAHLLSPQKQEIGRNPFLQALPLFPYCPSLDSPSLSFRLSPSSSESIFPSLMYSEMCICALSSLEVCSSLAQRNV